MKVEKKIRTLIKAKGFKISAVADRVGMDRKALYHALRDGRNLRADELVPLCIFLKIGIKDLADGWNNTGTRKDGD